MCGAHISGTPLQGTQLQRISSSAPAPTTSSLRATALGPPSPVAVHRGRRAPGIPLRPPSRRLDRNPLRPLAPSWSALPPSRHPAIPAPPRQIEVPLVAAARGPRPLAQKGGGPRQLVASSRASSSAPQRSAPDRGPRRRPARPCCAFPRASSSPPQRSAPARGPRRRPARPCCASPARQLVASPTICSGPSPLPSAPRSPASRYHAESPTRSSVESLLQSLHNPARHVHDEFAVWRDTSVGACAV